MKREAYDKVVGYMNRTGTTKVVKALKATKTNPGTYYRQKRLVEESPTYEVQELEPQPIPMVATHQPQVIRPGMVAMVGAPEDLAAFMRQLAGGSR